MTSLPINGYGRDRPFDNHLCIFCVPSASGPSKQSWLNGLSKKLSASSKTQGHGHVDEHNTLLVNIRVCMIYENTMQLVVVHHWNMCVISPPNVMGGILTLHIIMLHDGFVLCSPHVGWESQYPKWLMHGDYIADLLMLEFYGCTESYHGNESDVSSQTSCVRDDSAATPR